MTQVPIRILVVEDEPQMQKFLGASLASEGYRTLEATTGGEGVSLARTHNPDLVLLDLGLPDIDGMKVTEEIRAFSVKPIIVISAKKKTKFTPSTLARTTISPSRSVRASSWHAFVLRCDIRCGAKKRARSRDSGSASSRSISINVACSRVATRFI